MMASTGTATFHHVITLLTRAKMRMARKLTATKTAISTIITTKPALVTACRGVVDAGPEMRGVQQEREALDGRDRDGLHVGEEAEPDAGDASEREVREPGRAAGDRVHRAELGVAQSQDHDHDGGDDPGEDGGTSHHLGSESAANSQPEPMIEDSDAQVAPTSPNSRLRPMSVGLVAATDGVSVVIIDSLPNPRPGIGHFAQRQLK